jgi:hypothetical protein
MYCFHIWWNPVHSECFFLSQLGPNIKKYFFLSQLDPNIKKYLFLSQLGPNIKKDFFLSQLGPNIKKYIILLCSLNFNSVNNPHLLHDSF